MLPKFRKTVRTIEISQSSSRKWSFLVKTIDVIRFGRGGAGIKMALLSKVGKVPSKNMMQDVIQVTIIISIKIVGTT